MGWSSMPDGSVMARFPPVVGPAEPGSVEGPGVGSITVGLFSSRAGVPNLISLLCNFTGAQSFSSGVMTQCQEYLPESEPEWV